MLAGVTPDASPRSNSRYRRPYRVDTPPTHITSTRTAEKAPPRKQIIIASMYDRLHGSNQSNQRKEPWRGKWGTGFRGASTLARHTVRGRVQCAQLRQPRMQHTHEGLWEWGKRGGGEGGRSQGGGRGPHSPLSPSCTGDADVGLGGHPHAHVASPSGAGGTLDHGHMRKQRDRGGRQ